MERPAMSPVITVGDRTVVRVDEGTKTAAVRSSLKASCPIRTRR